MMNAPYEIARVRVLIGLACAALGDQETSAMEFDGARKAFDQLGAKADTERLDGLGIGDLCGRVAAHTSPDRRQQPHGGDGEPRHLHDLTQEDAHSPIEVSRVYGRASPAECLASQGFGDRDRGFVQHHSGEPRRRGQCALQRDHPTGGVPCQQQRSVDRLGHREDIADLALAEEVFASSAQRPILVPLAAERRLRIVDATHVKVSGSSGTDWRLHYVLHLPTLTCDFAEVTDASGGETYLRVPVQPGDIIIGEITPCIGGLFVQICRTMVLGEPPPITREKYNILKTAMGLGMDAAKTGAPAGCVATLSRRPRAPSSVPRAAIAQAAGTPVASAKPSAARRL
jgi:hypothetical protein